MGNEIERINFRRDGSIENRSVHLIDRNGRIAGWQEYETRADGKGERLTSRSEWIYDAAGNRIEASVYTRGVASDRTTARFDSAGHIVEEVMFTDGGAWKQTRKLTYDSAGRLTRTIFDTNGAVAVIEQGYDAFGNLAHYKQSGPSGDNDSEARYAYDASGRETERNAEDSISKFKMISSYDSAGRVTRTVTYFEYKLPNISRTHAPEPGTVEFRYDGDGRLIEESVYSPSGTLRRRTTNEYEKGARLRSQVYRNGDDVVVSGVRYQYDRWGNLVKRVTTSSEQSGKPITHVEHRAITYYDGK
jgi:YD repeat-containing protein